MVYEGSNTSDWFHAKPGADQFLGGLHEPTEEYKESLDVGFGDTVDYTMSTAGVNVSLGDQDGSRILKDEGIIPNVSRGYAEGDQLEGIENAVGSRYNDNLWGDRADNRLFGGRGSDFLWGDSGDDRLWGDFHGGSMYGDADVRLGGQDSLYGYTGNDMLEGGAGSDLLDGGPNGRSGDVAAYLKSDEGVTVNLNATEVAVDPLFGIRTFGTGSGGHAEGDLLIDIENVSGSQHDDLLTGDMGANHLRGRGGNDELRGGAYNATGPDGASGNDTLWGDDGDDMLRGGDGRDHLVGGRGSDTLEGGDGYYDDAGNWRGDWINGDGGGPTASHDDYRDAVSYEWSAGAVTVDLSMVNPRDGAVTPSGGDARGDDLFGIEDVVGSRMNGDVLTGDESANRIWGLGGNDTLDGGRGNDTLDGGRGSDDVEGSFGDDQLTGGPGGDKFIFEDVFGNDTITDFTNGSDHIAIGSLSTLALQAIIDNRKLNDNGDVVLEFDHDVGGVPLRGTITLAGYDLSDDLEVGIFDIT